MAKAKKRNGGGARKSTTKKVALTMGAVLAGGLAGAALGKLSLAAGAGAIIYGAMENNQLLTVAGAAAVVSPGLTSDEKSTAGGVTGILANAKTGAKKLAATVYEKTYIPVVAPNLLPSLTLGDVDANYYGNGLAEQSFNNAMARLNGVDDDVSGVDDSAMYLPAGGDMGRTPDAAYQELEASGQMAGLGAFADVAAENSANW